MSTARSWTDRRPGPGRAGTVLVDARRAVADVPFLLAFRSATLRGRARTGATLGVAVTLGLTVLAAWLPAYLPDGDTRRTDVLSLLPSAMAGVLLIAVVSAAASGGGRELVPRDQAVGFPVSPTSDHLGALLMAPLNIAWLLQAWTLLGATAYVVGVRPGLLLSQLVVLVWLVAATTTAQALGWGIEWLRRGPRGPGVVRGLTVAAGLAGAYLVASDRLVPLLQGSPTVRVAIASFQAAGGPTVSCVEVLLALLGLILLALVAGAAAAHAVARRPARDELQVETAAYPARPNPTSDLSALMRTDRAAIWRSVPLRRGLAVLAVMPGLVALAGDLQWDMLTILPGLVASGGALLFGVNAWCLDGRGALWRDSLPVGPHTVLASRALVLAEILVVATAGTLVLASLRAGLPTPRELAAVAACACVVVLQVTSASLRWSVRRPFSVDLRSARATPAPPLVMLGYSARLAVSTTLVGLLFSATARAPWQWSLLVALPLVLLSLSRLARTATTWADPDQRSRVVTTVAG